MYISNLSVHDLKLKTLLRHLREWAELVYASELLQIEHLTLQEADEGGVSLLGLEAFVEEERVLTRPPGLSVGDTPTENSQ